VYKLVQKSLSGHIDGNLTSVLRYDITQNPRIVHRGPQRLYQHDLKISHIPIIKSIVKQNNDSNKTCTYIHDLLL
jgi:hypothetical protein